MVTTESECSRSTNSSSGVDVSEPTRFHHVLCPSPVPSLWMEMKKRKIYVNAKEARLSWMGSGPASFTFAKISSTKARVETKGGGYRWSWEEDSGELQMSFVKTQPILTTSHLLGYNLWHPYINEHFHHVEGHQPTCRHKSGSAQTVS